MESQVEKHLAEVEPYICKFVRNHAIAGMEDDDFAQELRIIAMNMSAKYEAERGLTFIQYFMSVIKRRYIDVVRRHGFLSRKGKVNRITPLSFNDKRITNSSGSSDFSETAFDPIGINSDTHLENVHWKQLRKHTENDSFIVRAVLLRCEGFSIKEIGFRIGVSESRISQLLCDPVEWEFAIRRIRRLLGINEDLPITPYANTQLKRLKGSSKCSTITQPKKD